MSPHAQPWAEASVRPQLDLSQFSITKNAFLPEDNPAQIFSDSYYEPWERVAQNLPALIKLDVRQAIEELPILTTDRIQSESEWRRAYCLLAYLTHAYVWGGLMPQEVLPPQISMPFLAASDHLELPPVLTYAAANLWNFYSENESFTDLEGLSTMFSFTGTESEAWFLLISVAMEAKAAGLIDTVVTALESIKARNYTVIADALVKLRHCIDEVAILLERMHERCDPQIFYHEIRPMLAGSKNMESAGLPRGVFYDEGNGKGEWRQLRGGSNGQSSLIQFFDVALGIEHDRQSTCQGQRSFHDEVRDYMPGPHRRFLVHAGRMGSIRTLALEDATSEEHRRMQEAYTEATKALSAFRDKHIKIVTRYIILPSRQPRKGSQQNLATISSASETDRDSLTGTGGTTLVPFLKQTRDETLEAGDLTVSA